MTIKITHCLLEFNVVLKTCQAKEAADCKNGGFHCRDGYCFWDVKFLPYGGGGRLSETFLTIYQAIQRHICDSSNLQADCC